MKPTPLFLPALAALGLLLAGPPAAAQETDTAAPPAGAAASPEAEASEPVYRREVFRYDPRGRPDPFRPLVGTGELGVRLEELRLVGVVYNPDPRRSVATFVAAESARRVRLRTGERIGNVTVVAIYPRRVDVSVNEFGETRRETVILRRAPTPPAEPTPASGRPSQTETPEGNGR